MSIAILGFNPKQSVKRIIACLPNRAREIIMSRYGLGKDDKRMTLDSIGKAYHITRERVRQIENYALVNIRKSEEYKKEKAVFVEIENLIHSLGGVVVEEDLLKLVSKDKIIQNHIHFLLAVGEPFKKRKEDEEFRHRWHANEELTKKVEEALRNLYSNLNNQDLLPESEMINRFLKHLEEVSEKYKNHEVLKRWLKLSKNIGQNALGDWGSAHSPNIRTKGMRDYAFLVIRKHGSPIHFREVAKEIARLFNKKAHVATTHNELIKDSRFVLVGRGLYALAEWGYSPGVVREVIREMISKNGPLTKDQIIEKVLRERYVKKNTIIVNLQNPLYFKRDREGKYHSVPENKKDSVV